jgi:hypothetical protein
MVIVRKTWGFGKREDAISLSQFCSATGLKKPTVCKALRKLRTLNVITQKDNPSSNIFSINKDFDTWKPLPKKVTLPKKIIPITNKGNKRYPKSYPQKKVSKNTSYKKYSEGIPPYINLFPSEFQESKSFLQVWEDFLKYRKESKKPLTPTTAERLAAKLDELSDRDVIKAIAVLDQSIANSWVGVFPLNGDRREPPTGAVVRETFGD